jgi:hypothetical protein
MQHRGAQESRAVGSSLWYRTPPPSQKRILAPPEDPKAPPEKGREKTYIVDYPLWQCAESGLRQCGTNPVHNHAPNTLQERPAAERWRTLG